MLVLMFSRQKKFLFRYFVSIWRDGLGALLLFGLGLMYLYELCNSFVIHPYLRDVNDIQLIPYEPGY